MNKFVVVFVLFSLLFAAKANERKEYLQVDADAELEDEQVDTARLTIKPQIDGCGAPPCAVKKVVTTCGCNVCPCGTVPISITTVASELNALSDANVDAIIKKYNTEAVGSKEVKPVVSDSDVDHLTRDLGEIDEVKIVNKMKNKKNKKEKVAKEAIKEAERILEKAARRRSNSTSSDVGSKLDSRLSSIETALTSLRAAVDSQGDRVAKLSKQERKANRNLNSSRISRIIEDVAEVVSERVLSTLSANAAEKVFAKVEDKIEAVQAAEQKTQQTTAVEAAKIAVAQITKRPTGSKLEREGVIQAAVNAAVSETVREAQKKNATSGDPLREILRMAAFKAGDRVANRAEMIAPVNGKPTQKEIEKEERITIKKIPQVVELAIQRTLADSREKGLSLTEAIKEVANLAARTAAVEAKQASRKVRRQEKKLSKIETRAIKAASSNITSAASADSVKQAIQDVVQSTIRKEVATDIAVALGKNPQDLLNNVTAAADNSSSLVQLLDDIKAAQSLSFIEEDLHKVDV